MAAAVLPRWRPSGSCLPAAWITPRRLLTPRRPPAPWRRGWGCARARCSGEGGEASEVGLRSDERGGIPCCRHCDGCSILTDERAPAPAGAWREQEAGPPLPDGSDAALPPRGRGSSCRCVSRSHVGGPGESADGPKASGKHSARCRSEEGAPATPSPARGSRLQPQGHRRLGRGRAKPARRSRGTSWCTRISPRASLQEDR